MGEMHRCKMVVGLGHDHSRGTVWVSHFAEQGRNLQRYAMKLHFLSPIAIGCLFLAFVVAHGADAAARYKDVKKMSEAIEGAEKDVKNAELKLSALKVEMKAAKEHLKKAVAHLKKLTTSTGLKEDYGFQESKILSGENVKKLTKEIENTQLEAGKDLHSILGKKSSTEREIQKAHDVDENNYLRSSKGTQMSWIERSGDGEDVSRAYRILKKQMHMIKP